MPCFVSNLLHSFSEEYKHQSSEKKTLDAIHEVSSLKTSWEAWNIALGHKFIFWRRSEWSWLPDSEGDNYFSVSNNVEKVPLDLWKKLGVSVRKEFSCLCASEVYTISAQQVKLEPCVSQQWPMRSVYPQWDFLLPTLVTTHHPCNDRALCHVAFKEWKKEWRKVNCVITNC